ncbi:hypothetical protein HYT84_01310 [Candidatus Micrarchaeota archaeon]|nr:hypothetical protein [Candidatus Micrarchaeota archaeon]
MGKTFIVFVLVGMLFLSGCTLKGFENKQEALKEQEAKAKQKKLIVAVKDYPVTGGMEGIILHFEGAQVCNDGTCYPLPLPEEGIPVDLLDTAGYATVLGELELPPELQEFDEVHFDLADEYTITMEDGTTYTFAAPTEPIVLEQTATVSGETVVEMDFHADSFVPPPEYFEPTADTLPPYVAQPELETTVVTGADTSLGANGELVINEGTIEAKGDFEVNAQTDPTTGAVTYDVQSEVLPIEDHVDVYVDDTGVTYVNVEVNGEKQSYSTTSDNVENILSEVAVQTGQPVEQLAEVTLVQDEEVAGAAFDARQQAQEVLEGVLDKAFEASDEKVQGHTEVALQALANAEARLEESKSLPEEVREELSASLEAIRERLEDGEAGKAEELGRFGPPATLALALRAGQMYSSDHL